RSSASESWAQSNASSPAAGAASTVARNVAERGRKNMTASRTSGRMKSINVLSGVGARKGVSAKVMAADPGEDRRIPRRIGLIAAWGGDHTQSADDPLSWTIASLLPGS